MKKIRVTVHRLEIGGAPHSDIRTARLHFVEPLERHIDRREARILHSIYPVQTPRELHKYPAGAAGLDVVIDCGLWQWVLSGPDYNVFAKWAKTF